MVKLADKHKEREKTAEIHHGAIKVAQEGGLPNWRIRTYYAEGEVPYDVVEVGFKRPFLKIFSKFQVVISWEIDWVWTEVECNDEAYLDLAKNIEQFLKESGVCNWKV